SISQCYIFTTHFRTKNYKIHIKKRENKGNTVFEVQGPLFLAAVDSFIKSFDYSVEKTNITIDFSDSHIWDDSAVGAIDKVILKYSMNNNKVTITGLNSSSKKIIDKLAVHNNPNANVAAH